MNGLHGAVYVTDDGATVTLETPLGSGYEGSVWSVREDPAIAAKIFHGGQAPPRTRAKLICMIREQPPTTRCRTYRIAWPQSRLRQTAKSRTILGYTMPRLDADRHREIGAFLNQARRNLRVQSRGKPYTFLHMLTLARNIAQMVAEVHLQGHVIGDLSSRNVWADDRCQVALIDCDSMQVTDPRKQELHRCNVGTPEYTPPERQGVPFEQADRSIHDDNFALAVLIYQLMFQGRHPYAGVYHGRAGGPEQTTIPERIHTGRFVHSGDDGDYDPARHAQTIWRSLPFKKQMKSGLAHEGDRHAPQKWVQDIDHAAERIKQCSVNPNHQYFGSDGCTWCRFRRITKTEPFPLPGKPQTKEGKRRTR